MKMNTTNVIKGKVCLFACLLLNHAKTTEQICIKFGTHIPGLPHKLLLYPEIIYGSREINYRLKLKKDRTDVHVGKYIVKSLSCGI